MQLVAELLPRSTGSSMGVAPGFHLCRRLTWSLSTWDRNEELQGLGEGQGYIEWSALFFKSSHFLSSPSWLMPNSKWLREVVFIRLDTFDDGSYQRGTSFAGDMVGVESGARVDGAAESMSGRHLARG